MVGAAAGLHHAGTSDVIVMGSLSAPIANSVPLSLPLAGQITRTFVGNSREESGQAMLAKRFETAREGATALVQSAGYFETGAGSEDAPPDSALGPSAHQASMQSSGKTCTQSPAPPGGAQARTTLDLASKARLARSLARRAFGINTVRLVVLPGSAARLGGGIRWRDQEAGFPFKGCASLPTTLVFLACSR